MLVRDKRRLMIDGIVLETWIDTIVTERRTVIIIVIVTINRFILIGSIVMSRIVQESLLMMN